MRHRSAAARTALLLAGSVAAGVHAGLAPEHLREWPPLGASFVAAAVALAGAVAALALRPDDERPARLLALLLAGLVVAYAATRIAALPPLDPEREELDTLGLLTSAVEVVGLVLALHLGRRPTRRRLTLTPSTGGSR